MIGDVLKLLRSKTGLSQKAFAEKYGINSNTLASYELNKNEPNIEMLIKFSQIYDVSVDYLVGNALPGYGDYKTVLDKYGALSAVLFESITQMLNAGINIGKPAEMFESIILLKDCIRNLETVTNTSIKSARETVKQYNIPLLKEIQLDGSPAKECANPSNGLYMASFISHGIDKAIIAKDKLNSLLDEILKEFSLDLLNLRYKLAYMKSEYENGNLSEQILTSSQPPDEE